MSSLSNLVGSFANNLNETSDIKDIITFLEAPWGLNINSSTMPILPAQKVILKIYYKIPLDEKEKLVTVKDKFNERTLYTFTEQEYLNYLYNEGRCNIKYIDDKNRNELVFIAGRRSGKSTLASWIAAYETYRLLKIYHPQQHFRILPDAEIHIVSVATSEDQANTLFRTIISHFTKCTYFHRYLNKPTQEKVAIRSRRDLEKYGEEGKASIFVASSACSARSLRSKGILVAIMDEQAHFVDEKTQSNKSDKSVYDAITPAVADFKGEGKIINISSPLNKSGVLWDLYNSSLEGADNILMIKAPTWEINPTVESGFLKARHHSDPITYDCEFGGNFSDKVKSWLPEEYLRPVIDTNLRPKKSGKLRTPYFMGIDLGLKGDGTAVAISHIENILEENGTRTNKIELDFIEARYAGEPPYENAEILDFELIADWIQDLCNRFYIVKGLIDQGGGGPVAIQNLNKRGLSQFDLIYHSRNFNSDIYQNFMMLLIDRKIRLYNVKPDGIRDDDYIKELLELQVHQFSKNIIQVAAPKTKGCHDDYSDALVRSIWLASEAMNKGLSGSLSIANNRYTSYRDANHYALSKARVHPNLSERSIKKQRTFNWMNKYGK